MSRIIPPLCAVLAAALYSGACFDDPVGIAAGVGDPGGVGGSSGGGVSTSDPEELRNEECRAEAPTVQRAFGRASDPECDGMLSGVMTGICGDLTYIAMSTGYTSSVFFYDSSKTLIGTRESTDDFSFCNGAGTRVWGQAPSRKDCEVWEGGVQMCPGL